MHRGLLRGEGDAVSIRTKTLGIIAATLVVLAITVYVSSSQIVLGRFSDLEQAQAAENLERARGAIDTEVARINSAGGDWAAWDDTYEFVQDGNQSYIDDNLAVDSLLNLRVNMMLFFDNDQDLIVARGLDMEEEAEVPVSEDTVSSISDVPGLLRFEGTSDFGAGLVSTSDGVLLLSARPIITSERGGPIMGSFVIARHLDAALLEELTAVTELSLSAVALESIAGGDQIEAVDGRTLTASTALVDVSGNPAFGLQAEMPRDVYQRGQDTIRYLLFVLLGIGVAFGLLVTVLLEGVVVRPVRRLSSFVLSVGGSLDKRAPEMGRDEIGKLGHSVNEMLESIETSTRALETANKELVQERAQVELLNRSLEQKVEERTNDLRLTNEELKDRNRQLIKARVQAATDGLTGLANHRSFYERVAEISLTGRPVGVLMMDLDGFKQINDQHGHQMGDQMLVAVAEVLRSAVGEKQVFRYGGDEFAILVDAESLEDARLLAEQLRTAVFERVGESGLTISVGVSLYPMIASSPKEAVYQADAAMYVAKSAGKNAVRVWHAVSAPAPSTERSAVS